MKYRGIFKLPGLFNQYKYSGRTTQTFKTSLSSAVICATNEITQVAFHISSNVITGCVFVDKLLRGGGPSRSLHVCDHSLSTWGLTRHGRPAAVSGGPSSPIPVREVRA